MSWGQESSLRGWRRRQLGRGVTRPEQPEEKAAAHLDGTAESRGSASGGGAAATDRVGSGRAMALGPGMEGSGPGPQEADWSRRSSGTELRLGL